MFFWFADRQYSTEATFLGLRFGVKKAFKKSRGPSIPFNFSPRYSEASQDGNQTHLFTREKFTRTCLDRDLCSRWSFLCWEICFGETFSWKLFCGVWLDTAFFCPAGNFCAEKDWLGKMGTEKKDSIFHKGLERLCLDNGWSYGVLWRFDQRNSL